VKLWALSEEGQGDNAQSFTVGEADGNHTTSELPGCCVQGIGIYHVPFPVIARASWGFWGSYIAIISRVILAIFWFDQRYDEEGQGDNAQSFTVGEADGNHTTSELPGCCVHWISDALHAATWQFASGMIAVGLTYREALGIVALLTTCSVSSSLMFAKDKHKCCTYYTGYTPFARIFGRTPISPIHLQP
jgi:hypothetical protein